MICIVNLLNDFIKHFLFVHMSSIYNINSNSLYIFHLTNIVKYLTAVVMLKTIIFHNRIFSYSSGTDP